MGEIELRGTPMTSSLWARLTTGNVFLAAKFLDIPLAFAPPLVAMVAEEKMVAMDKIIVAPPPVAMVAENKMVAEDKMVAMNKTMVAMDKTMVAMVGIAITIDKYDI